MKRIELNDAEIEVIKQQLNGEIEIWNATDEQQKLLSGVIEKADALMAELNAYDDDYSDLILWFWNKYEEQENTAE